MDEKTIRKIEGHLRGTFANARITLVPRPKQKDSAEVYVGEEFIGVVFEDEDGAYVVVDYKTDLDVTPRLASYEAQVALYGAAIRDATGRPVRGVVLVV